MEFIFRCSAFSAGFCLRRTSVRLGRNPCAALIIEKISPSGLKTKFALKGMTSNEVEVSFVGEVFL
jgi:hypothetical protein